MRLFRLGWLGYVRSVRLGLFVMLDLVGYVRLPLQPPILHGSPKIEGGRRKKKNTIASTYTKNWLFVTILSDSKPIEFFYVVEPWQI